MVRHVSMQPSEALAIGNNAATLLELEWANEFRQAYNATQRNDREQLFDECSMIAMAFMAGMAQGVRDERKNHKAGDINELFPRLDSRWQGIILQICKMNAR